MRRILILALAGLVAAAPLSSAFAQQRSDRQAADKARQEAEKQKRVDEEMALDNLPLPDVVNAGPCPFVKILYDASRTIDFKDDRRSASAVVFSGELEGISARCTYQGAEPIVVNMLPTFSFGRGPQATTPTREFHYWVAVTDRNKSVLSKQYLTITPKFPSGGDRVVVAGEQMQITIPRLNDQVSGANFEILVGFEVTPQIAEFNRLGSRFLANADGTLNTASAGPTPGTPPAQ